MYVSTYKKHIYSYIVCMYVCVCVLVIYILHTYRCICPKLRGSRIILKSISAPCRGAGAIWKGREKRGTCTSEKCRIIYECMHRMNHARICCIFECLCASMSCFWKQFMSSGILDACKHTHMPGYIHACAYTCTHTCRYLLFLKQ